VGSNFQGFSLLFITKSAYVHHTRIHSWNQPLLSIDSKEFCLRKQHEPLMEFEILPEKHPPITSQTQ